MSKITELIFKGEKHYVTSGFGYRKVLSTKGGYTSSYHSGTDYGTNGRKIAQYAIEDGSILSCGRASDGANYVWVNYPRINVKMLHYHLDSIACKSGQKVSRGTLLGYTGMTGKATGVHLHLGVYDLKKKCYINPEGFVYEEKKTKARNYYMKGDKNDYIKHLCTWFADHYYGYFCKNKKSAHKLLDGNLFGPYLEKWVKEFQKRTKLKADGYIGPKTQSMLKKYGFKG